MSDALVCLALLALLLIPGAPAEAAGGVGVNLRIYVHNIPRAVAAGRHLNTGKAVGPQPSRSLSTPGARKDVTGDGRTFGSPE